MRRLNTIPRILVTGTRGKSSVVRLVHAAMIACGLKAYARVTGVIPMQLCPEGSRRIIRTAAPHIQEMKWWLTQLPDDVGAVIMENSAIAPDLQGMAARWLNPDLIVLTNTDPDHQEVWGATADHALHALLKGVPAKACVVIPDTLLADTRAIGSLKRIGCTLIPAFTDRAEGFWKVNISLAMAVTSHLGLDSTVCRRAMHTLDLGRFDFQVRPFQGTSFAMAFAINDIRNTQKAFNSLGWIPRETRILYNHRRDRAERLKSFAAWFSALSWKEVTIIGDQPTYRIQGAKFLPATQVNHLAPMFRPGDKIFGCGNVAGLPLALPL